MTDASSCAVPATSSIDSCSSDPARGVAPPPGVVSGVRNRINKPCFAFHKDGICMRGSTCKFMHDQPFVVPPHRWRESLDVHASACALPHSLRTHRLCKIADDDLAAELLALVRSALHLATGQDMAKLHELPEAAYMLEPKGRARNNHYYRRWTAAVHARGSEWRTRFDACMKRLIAEHVGVDALEASAHGYTGVVYQALPSLRLHLPNDKLGIALHKDADYFHQPNEVNMWIPISDHVGGSNSLFCESAPGKGDFAPFEVPSGSFMRFFGNQCLHHTVINTSEFTRVSLDVRCVPRELYDDNWANPQGRVCFRLGEYYDEVDVAGRVAVEVG